MKLFFHLILKVIYKTHLFIICTIISLLINLLVVEEKEELSKIAKTFFLNWRFSFYPQYCPVLSVSKWLFSLNNEMCNLKTAPDKRILWNYLQSCNNKIVGFDNPVFDVCQKGELFHTGFLLKIASFLRIARAFGCWPEKCQEIKAVGLYITYSVFIYSANENKWITGIQLNFGCCNRKRFVRNKFIKFGTMLIARIF